MPCSGDILKLTEQVNSFQIPAREGLEYAGISMDHTEKRLGKSREFSAASHLKNTASLYADGVNVIYKEDGDKITVTITIPVYDDTQPEVLTHINDGGIVV